MRPGHTHYSVTTVVCFIWPMSTCPVRYPCLVEGDTSANLENRSFMKEVKGLVDLRRRTWDPALFDKQGQHMYWEDFLHIKQRSQYIIHSVLFCQSRLRRQVFGDKFWGQHEAELRRVEGHRLQNPKQPNSKAMVRNIICTTWLAHSGFTVFWHRSTMRNSNAKSTHGPSYRMRSFHYHHWTYVYKSITLWQALLKKSIAEQSTGEYPWRLRCENGQTRRASKEGRPCQPIWTKPLEYNH